MLKLSGLALTVMLLAVPVPIPQSAPVRDPQAISVLNQSLSAAGGLVPISAVQDYTGTGNIAYSWADQSVQCPLIVRGMGTGNFRIDASLSNGTRTWAASGYSGVLITPDGTRQQTAFYNLMTAGSMTLPYVRIAAILGDSTTSIAYVGLVSVNGGQAYQVHFAPAVDPSITANNSLPGLGAFDVFFDPTSFLVTRLTETVRSETDFTTTYPHQIDFSNYQTTGGIQAPLTIAETVNGQTTWTMTLSSLTFNNGLTDDIFNP